MFFKKIARPIVKKKRDLQNDARIKTFIDRYDNAVVVPVNAYFRLQFLRAISYRVFTRSSKHRAGSSRPIGTPPLAQM